MSRKQRLNWSLNMKVLVINAGSSSLKYQLIDMNTESALAVGLCERIGIKDGIITQKRFDGKKFEKTTGKEVKRTSTLCVWTLSFLQEKV